MSATTGTGALIRLILRRDRIILPLWILIVVLVPVGIAASAIGLYNTVEALQAYANEAMSTPASLALLGRVYSPTVGGVVAWRSGLQSAILIGIPALLLVIRHTRSEEEAGRRELLGGAVLGREAPLAAALSVVGGSCLVIGALIAAGLIALGLPAAGSVALGLSAASAGCFCAALGGVAAQLAESPGAARGLALLAYCLLYVLRSPADLGGPAQLTWLSPFGWLRQTRAFAGEQWWVFALLLGLAVGLAAAAFALSARRDLGAGLLALSVGPAAAAPTLSSPLALAWRLQKGPLLAWTAGFAAFGVALGAVAPSIGKFVDVPQLQGWVTRMGAHDAGEAFLFMVTYILGQIAAAFAITAALRLRSEEVAGRADPVLATAVGRLRWAGSHLTFALLGPAAALLALGLPVAVLYSLSLGDLGQQLPRLLARTMAVLPAAWVMVGLAALLWGLVPRLADYVVWGALAVFLLLELFWELGQVSQAVFDLSPFAWVHWATPVSAAPLVGLTTVAAVLTAAGLAAFRRRDVG